MPITPDDPTAPELGTFSVSLAVTDLVASRAFYQAFGFEVVDGDGSSWQILRRDGAILGLFQGMFDRNIVTFNPPDVRALQRHLKDRGLAFEREADENGEGPDHATLLDPDGNPVLLDQHV